MNVLNGGINMKRLMLAALAASMVVSSNVFALTEVKVITGITAATLLNLAVFGINYASYSIQMIDTRFSDIDDRDQDRAKSVYTRKSSLVSTAQVAGVCAAIGAVVTLCSKKKARAASFTAVNALVGSALYYTSSLLTMPTRQV